MRKKYLLLEKKINQTHKQTEATHDAVVVQGQFFPSPKPFPVTMLFTHKERNERLIWMTIWHKVKSAHCFDDTMIIWTDIQEVRVLLEAFVIIYVTEVGEVMESWI